MPLNPAFSGHQVHSALSHLGASHLILSTETKLSRKPPRSNKPLIDALLGGTLEAPSILESVPTFSSIVLVKNHEERDHVDLKRQSDSPRFIDFKEIFNYSPDLSSSSRYHLHKNDVINIQFTSGTTSAPKAACLTHRSILNNGNSIGDRMLLTSNDIVCCPPPLFHCFGSILGYMATATHGSAIVFPSDAFDPTATLNAVQEENCTALYGVPTMFLSELEVLKNGTLASEGFEQLRTGIAAGTSIPTELMRRLHQDLNLKELTICYGMTETSPVSCMTTTNDPLKKRIETVGRVLPHVDVKVVDRSDKGKIMAVGRTGELAVSGYLLMQGYWNDEHKTQEVMIKDDVGKLWMHVGPSMPLYYATVIDNTV